jgi:hypothetical protein
VTVKLPAATPVAVTVQLSEDRVQLAPTVPIAVLDEVKLTEPDGTFDGVVVSVTVTVHVEVPPGRIVLGLQETLVDALSFVTVIVPEVPELPLWVESPPYVPVTVAEPGATPVNVTVQPPDDKVQLAPTVPTVVSEDVNVTLPVGAFNGVVVSETVTVHVEVPPMLMLLGEQATAVEVLSSEATLNMTVVVWISEALVPVTVTVTLPVDVNVHDSVDVPEPPITLGGVRVQAVLSLVRSTVPVKPLTGAIVIVEVPGELTTTGTVVGLAVMVKSEGEVTATDMVAVELVMSLLVPPAPLIVRE